MGTIYVIGAGFSRTCDIATDNEMLDVLNALLKKDETKSGRVLTWIEAIREQNFAERPIVGFEEFMSTISALKFMPEFLGHKPNLFAEAEREIRQALKHYLRQEVKKVDWHTKGKSIIEFVKRANWKQDLAISFNYDLLLESAMDRVGIEAKDRILLLHGSVAERTLAYPTYKKLAYRNARSTLAKRWGAAFKQLRKLSHSDRLVFIGYSMPPSDFEAKGLFNYTDWYNRDSAHHYRYPIIVVNKDPDIKSNYSFMRRAPEVCIGTFSRWVDSGAVGPMP